MQYALELGKIMEKSGYDVIFTRQSDNSTSGRETGKVRSLKADDIHNRFKVISDNPDAIFISIHMNKYPSENCRGYQMFYSPKNPASEILANTITKNFDLKLNPVKKRVPKKCEKNVYLMYNSPLPSVLVECGFISSSEDLKLLKDSEYCKKMMSTLAASINEFIAANKNDSNTTTDASCDSKDTCERSIIRKNESRGTTNEITSETTLETSGAASSINIPEVSDDDIECVYLSEDEYILESED